MSTKVSVSIDRGGTFTDVVATVRYGDGRIGHETCKLLSVNPEQYPDAPSEGIRRILERIVPEAQRPVRRPIPTAMLEEIRMGTTVATNALLERRGVPSVLVVTRGFRDILQIGNQARGDIFALNIQKPSPLPTMVIEANERLRLVTPASSGNAEVVVDDVAATSSTTTATGHTVEVWEPLDEAQIRADLQHAYDQGLRSVGVCLLHSYALSGHEQAVGAIARDIGFTNVSLSSDLISLAKYVPRTTTASVDAYLTPLIAEYVAHFRQHFVDTLDGVRLYFIQSDGGLTSANEFFGFKAVLSGPAGGAVGCARTTSRCLGRSIPMVGFDMGGTSTDVCRCEGTRVEHVVEATIGGAVMQAPQVDVHTVAAGGGSILKWENSMFVVGPESAGANPGPASYGKGGPLTVTDANLLVGRIHESYFPKIFGPSGTEPLNKAIVVEKFEALRRQILSANASHEDHSIYDIALSFIKVANETMSRPIRNLTEAKGLRPDKHVLTAFGGAGGQHACGIATSLGIRRVFIPRLSSYLSAVGIGETDVVEDRLESCSLPWADSGPFQVTVSAALERMQAAVVQVLASRHGFPAACIKVDFHAGVRFQGTNTEIMTPITVAPFEPNALRESFLVNYQRQFGFVLHERGLVVDSLWVRARGVSTMAVDDDDDDKVPAESLYESYCSVEGLDACRVGTSAIYFDSVWIEAGVYALTSALHAKRLSGPCVILGDGATIVVDPRSTAFVTRREGNVVIVADKAVERITTECRPLPLSLFAHRFMSIAEQMGYALQRTAISTNIKERLDFSCAIFDPDGRLVANAPHIPVHLGAMGAAIRWQRDYYGADWKEGDVMLSNHPAAGGSHLPDITVMTACFHEGNVIFYVASRGHHADVGGTTPGSMPPFSHTLQEEGAAIKTLRLVVGGVFNEEGLRSALLEPGTHPGMSGCRTLDDSVSDLKAKVAANQRGVALVKALVEEFGLDVVQAYMRHIQDTASSATRAALRHIAARYGTDLSSEDRMDDGTAIRLKIRIDADAGSAVFDFRGSDPQVLSSTNCPTAVVHSAVIYCLRCIVGTEIPLNHGCLEPVEVLVRPGSILAPHEGCAVVAGNVLTSQRVTDVIFTALRAVACAQGCMNNFTFGGHKVAYYETICGGSGAGPTFDGASCVQTHMTNTRITDPEILEARYPVMLAQFGVRRGSGGRGAHRGGDGCVRSVLFLSTLTMSISSERRALAPQGLMGGQCGLRGRNLLHVWHPSSSAGGGGDVPRWQWRELRTILWKRHTTDDEVATGIDDADSNGCRSSYRTVNISGKNTLEVHAGDVLQVFTPGGGGFGEPERET